MKLDLAAIGNDDLLRCLSTLASQLFHLLDNVHSFNDLPKNDVLSIQPAVNTQNTK